MPRPLEHKREDVLEAAMQVFWDKGYFATSMTDLKTATGLNPGSLYSSYQSKEDLFILSLQFYCDRSLGRIASTLNKAGDPIENVYLFFRNFLEKTEHTDKGCLFVNSLIEMSPHNQRVKKLLEKYTQKYQQLFFDALQKAVSTDQIPANTDIDAISNQLMLTIWGLRVMQRSGVTNQSQEGLEKQLDKLLRCF